MKKNINNSDFIIIHTVKKKYLTRVEKDKSFCTKRGVLRFNDIIEKEYGVRINSHYILKPTLDDIVLLGIKRETQIIYPKEAGQILVKLNLQNGFKVFECGTGSGALSLFISQAIAPDGILYTYEKQKNFYLNAKNNIDTFGKNKNIKMLNENIDEGIKEKDFDAAFIDLKEPQNYIEWLKSILKKGAPLGILVPTTNQISNALRKLERHFYDIEIMEILIRNYIPNPSRLRPKDIMVGHTGFLIFAR